MRHGIVVAALIVACGFGYGVSGATAAPAPGGRTPASAAIAAADYCADGEALAFLDLINEYRAEHGEEALALSQTLGAAAEHHSLDMAANDAFSPLHVLSDGTSAFDNIIAHGYPADALMGENIAAGAEAAADVFALWQASPPHDENMLNPAYRAIGIGRAYGPDASYDWFWTTTFGDVLDVPATICGGAPSAAGAAAVTTTDVNLRAAPSLEADVLMVLPAGTPVFPSGDAADGFAAVTAEGRDGWVWADYLAPAEETTPSVSAGTSLTTMTRLNLRAGPSLEDDVMTVIPAGATVTATGDGANGFLAVEYDGQAGWAHGAYLVASDA